MADERVFHAGDAVAAVAAVTEQIAEEACEKIKVEYEPLEPVYDPVEAMKDEIKVHPPLSNIYATKRIKKGDLEKGFAEADHVFEGVYSTQMIEHVPLEPHASIAQWDPNGRVTLWSSLGRITLGRADIARTLEMPINKIRIVGTHRRRQLRRQERDHHRAGPGAALAEDGTAGENGLYPRRGIHRLDDPSPVHHGVQDRRNQRRHDHRPQGPPRLGWRRLLFVE